MMGSVGSQRHERWDALRSIHRALHAGENALYWSTLAGTAEKAQREGMPYGGTVPITCAILSWQYPAVRGIVSSLPRRLHKHPANWWSVSTLRADIPLRAVGDMRRGAYRLPVATTAWQEGGCRGTMARITYGSKCGPLPESGYPGHQPGCSAVLRRATSVVSAMARRAG